MYRNKALEQLARDRLELDENFLKVAAVNRKIIVNCLNVVDENIREAEQEVTELKSYLENTTPLRQWVKKFPFKPTSEEPPIASPPLEGDLEP